MENYKLNSKKSKKNFDLLRNPLRAKAHNRIGQFEKPAQNNFSLPHTPIFYLFWHALSATLNAARAKSAEPDALPSGVTFERQGDFGVYTKGRHTIAVDFDFYQSTICKLPKKELAIFPLALVYLLSQSRQVGRSWKKSGAIFEVTRQGFLEFAGIESGKASARVLKAALLAIQKTQIIVGKQPPQSLYNGLENTTPPTVKSKQYSAGFKITVDKDNKAFGLLNRATHTMPNAAARVLKLRDFLVYLELKSAYASGFESTAVDNIIRAGDFGRDSRNITRPRGRIKATLKRIVEFEPSLKGLWADFANNQIRFDGAPDGYFDEPPPPKATPTPSPQTPSSEPPPDSLPQIVPAVFVANVNVYLFGNGSTPIVNYLSVTPLELEREPSTPTSEPPTVDKSEPSPPRIPSIFDNLPDPTRLLPAPPRKKLMRAPTFDSLPCEFITDRPGANDDSYNLNTKAGKARLRAFLSAWRPLIQKVIGKLKNGVKIAPSLLYSILVAFCADLLALLEKLTNKRR